jgi:hypothetical protein
LLATIIWLDGPNSVFFFKVPANNNIPIAMDLRDFYISTEWDIMAVPGVREVIFNPL